MLLDPESLRCFEAVAAALSFRAASQRLALSPTAVSERVRRLEEQLGARLFERSTRRVLLTAAGERLLPQARHVLEAHARAFERVRAAERYTPTELWVGTRFELGLSWLVPALPRLEAAAPGRTLHLHFGDGPELLARLRAGGTDCAVTSARIAEGDFDHRQLHAEEYTLVAARTLVAQRSFRGAADAPRHVLLDLSPDLPLSRYFLDHAGGGALWPFARLEFLGTIGAVRLRVLQARGIAVLPDYFVADDLRRGRMVRLLPRLKLPRDHFRLVWRRGHRKTAALEQLAEELRAVPLR
jgi:DNA-binding transcriptional LysR family regulator